MCAVLTMSILPGSNPRPSTAAACSRSRSVSLPAAHVIGCPIEYLVADLGVLEADADQLHEVLRRDPNRQPTPIDRRIAEIADADAGDAQSMLECIKRAESLAEGLAHAITRIRAHGRIDPDASTARI